MSTGTKENKTNLSVLGLWIELKAKVFVLQKKSFYLFPFLIVFVLEISPEELRREKDRSAGFDGVSTPREEES